MKKIKIIFVGTDWIGTRLLESLAHLRDFFEVQLVITGQDKPAGRKLLLQPSPIKVVAENLGLEVYQPLDINAELSVRKLENLAPDFILLMAYGQLLKETILTLPKIDCVNVHPSLLPKYRGASPVQSPILNGDTMTGVSLMKMVQKMDAGPIYKQVELPVEPEDTGQTLADKLGLLSAVEIPKMLLDIVEGKLIPEAQDEKKVTYCAKISKNDGLIHWNEPSSIIAAKVRAYDPWPGTYTFFRSKRLKILKAITFSGFGQAGQVTKQGIACQKGVLKPLIVQTEGGMPQSYGDFLHGHGDFIGSNLSDDCC